MWVFSSRRTIPLFWKWNYFPDIVLKLCTSGALNWSSSALLGFPSLSPSDMSGLFHRYIRIIYHRYIKTIPLIYQDYFTDLSWLFHRYIRSSALLGFPSLSSSDMSGLFHRYIRIIYHRYIKTIPLIYQDYFTDLSWLFHRYIRSSALLGFPSLSPSDMSGWFFHRYIRIIYPRYIKIISQIYQDISGTVHF